MYLATENVSFFPSRIVKLKFYFLFLEYIQNLIIVPYDRVSTNRSRSIKHKVIALVVESTLTQS